MRDVGWSEFDITQEAVASVAVIGYVSPSTAASRATSAARRNCPRNSHSMIAEGARLKTRDRGVLHLNRRSRGLYAVIETC